jgi:hypothetical protein
MTPRTLIASRLVGTLLALTGLTLLAALTCATVPGWSSAARHAFAFDLSPQHVDVRDALHVFATNARFVIGIALAAWLAHHHHRLAAAVDVLVVAVVVVNVALVGAAIGAYRLAVLPWLIHLPVEWAAIAAAAADYRRARAGGWSWRDATSTTSVAVGLLAIAAVFETYATPHT